MFHQLHLVFRVLLQRLDVWEHAQHHPFRYFDGVATLVNLWWSSGVGWTVRKTSESMFGATGARLLSKVRGSALRGGWSRIDSIESLPVRTWQYDLEVFMAVFAQNSFRTDLILELVRKKGSDSATRTDQVPKKRTVSVGPRTCFL